MNHGNANGIAGTMVSVMMYQKLRASKDYGTLGTFLVS